MSHTYDVIQQRLPQVISAGCAVAYKEATGTEAEVTQAVVQFDNLLQCLKLAILDYARSAKGIAVQLKGAD